MRVIIGKGTSSQIKSEIISDTKINFKEGLLLDFPTPAYKVKISIVKDNKSPTLILLFD